MNFVEPIRDLDKIKEIKVILESNPRNHLLFSLGLSLALRISDLLALKVCDVVNENGTVREVVYVREKKTRKAKSIAISQETQKEIASYLEKMELEPNHFLFPSRQGKNKPLNRRMAWLLINRWCEAVGLGDARYGTHTLRKTWGYHARKRYNVPIELIQAKYGHTHPEITKRYVGITNGEINSIEKIVSF